MKDAQGNRAEGLATFSCPEGVAYETKGEADTNYPEAYGTGQRWDFGVQMQRICLVSGMRKNQGWKEEKRGEKNAWDFHKVEGVKVRF